MNNPNALPKSEPWICKGTPNKPHSEIENWGDNCIFLDCKNSRIGLHKTVPFSPSDNRKKLMTLIGITLTLTAGLGSGVYLWQKFKPCPRGQEKQNGVCLLLSNSINSPTSSPTTITFNPDWVSQSDRILFKGSSNKDRDLGIEAVKNGDYAAAIKYFEKAVFSNRNDPEVQIYLNNARAALQGSPLKIAAVVPVDNRATSAQEMLRGVADAQTRFNDEVGVGGRLVQIIIANDGNEPQRAQSIARQLASDAEILGVIGHNSSSASEAALAEYTQGGLAMISPTSTSTSLKSNYFFRTVPTNVAHGQKLAEYANNMGINQVAVFYNPRSSYSKSLQQAFETHFQQLGGNVLGSIDLKDPNFDPKQQIQTIQGQVDAIALFPNTDTTSVAIGITRANKELSTPKLPMLGGDALYSSQTLNDGGSAVNGLAIAIPWFAADQSYARTASQRWIGAVNWRTAASFDATQALLKTLAINPTRASVLQNLPTVNLNARETAGEPLSFVNGERLGEPVLVKILPGAIGKPRDFNNGFQLIQP
ncbi:MAG: ABC transporter substrate-binding protein [Cyanobacteria bacterium P01_A01_bin.40]